MKIRLLQIDSAKLFFCFAVVMFHYSMIFSPNDTSLLYSQIPAMVYDYGYLGVEFFFISSGYLIAHNYKERLMNKGLSVISFIKNRFIALYPMYFVTCIIGMLVAIIDNRYTNGEIAGRVVNLYYSICTFSMTAIGWTADYYGIYGAGMWFVGIIMICYVIYGIITSMAKNRDAYIIFVFGMIFLGWYLYLNNKDIILLYQSNARGYMNFFIGCLLYEIQTSLNKRRLEFISTIGIVLIFTIIFRIMIDRNLDFFGNVDLCCTLLIFPLIIIVVNNVSFIKKILCNKNLIKVSSLSTSIFFTHGNLFFAIRIIDKYYGLNIDYSSPTIFWGVFVIVIVTAYMFKLLVEEKMTRYVKIKLSER